MPLSGVSGKLWPALAPWSQALASLVGEDSGLVFCPSDDWYKRGWVVQDRSWAVCTNFQWKHGPAFLGEKHPRDLPPSVTGHPGLKRSFSSKDFVGFVKRSDQSAFVQRAYLEVSLLLHKANFYYRGKTWVCLRKLQRGGQDGLVLFQGSERCQSLFPSRFAFPCCVSRGVPHVR